MSALFSPLRIGQLELANRIVVAPMCQYSADEGRATDWHLMHWGELAASGAGLLILEATGVSPEARISAQDLGLYDDSHEVAITRALSAARRYTNTPVAVQLAHAGRKASTLAPWVSPGGQVPPDAPGGWQTVAPSAQAYAPGWCVPQALDEQGIAKVRADFAQAARRAGRLGLDGIEVHAAHGYLLHQFLSPLSNQRSDAYGGSLENRLRLTLEVFDAVRAAFPPERPVWVRVSATDWVPGGWDLDSTVALAQALKARGSDAMHVSTGGLSPAQVIDAKPGYQLPFAQRIKAETGLPTIGVGLITEPKQAQAVITSGQADAVGLARAFLYNPRWPWHAAAQLGAQVQAPPQYGRATPAGVRDLFKPASSAKV